MGEWNNEVKNWDIWPSNDLDLGDNFAIWCHCIISYYEQFEVFDFEMTLTFDLQLNLILTILHNILLGVSSYCGKYEVFDPIYTRTTLFDNTLHPYYPSPDDPHPLLVPLSLLPFPLPPSTQEPHPLTAPFIPITPSPKEPHPLLVRFIPLTTPSYHHHTTPFANTLHHYQHIPQCVCVCVIVAVLVGVW